VSGGTSKGIVRAIHANYETGAQNSVRYRR